ncbi:conserved hypothetical protein [Crenothrix polyspora]|uniref:DUF2442 domain-containing protein n=1 Tax=Crenothrix polyspora TaxID=360316 RepID=A0A1R4H641_9GAMM|nr:DUF2442 domain-containing protein [Crenothrix polyspora]SJM91723.1 conserved hypothetical protein [Crenothrix polyspora]
MTPDVIQVKPKANYSIEVVFENGETRLFDMKPYLQYPAFSLLGKNNFFMNAHVANGTVAWNDEIDLSQDTLYLRGVPI